MLAELRDLVTREEGLKVPEDRAFYLRFLRAGLSKPSDGLEIIKNYFLLRKNHFKYFKVSSIILSILPGCCCKFTDFSILKYF